MSLCWLLGQEGKGVIFTITLIAWSGFNLHPGHNVVSLDKTVYDDYLCLVVSNNQQIYVGRSQMLTGRLDGGELLTV